MSVVAKGKVQTLIDHGNLEITSSDPNHQFAPFKQITNSGIDLRLGYDGYVIDPDALDGRPLDTLASADPTRYFRKVLIPPEGYIIEPGGFLLASTLEIVRLAAGEYIGRIIGRSLYARMGLSIHCTQPKFSGGNRSIVPLQLINHSPVPLRVYPRQRIATLQIELMNGPSGQYTGHFSEETSIRLPLVPDSEREDYSPEERSVMFRESPVEPRTSGENRKRRVNIAGTIIKALLTTGATLFGGVAAGLLVLPPFANPIAQQYRGYLTVGAILAAVTCVLATVLYDVKSQQSS